MTLSRPHDPFSPHLPPGPITVRVELVHGDTPPVDPLPSGPDLVVVDDPPPVAVTAPTRRRTTKTPRARRTRKATP